MARTNIPGLKKSTGMVTYEKLVEGEYDLECISFEEKALYQNAPGTCYAPTFTVISGPPQADGKSPKGRKFWHNINFKSTDHPDMTGKDVADQPAVHELKALCTAAGVDIKGDGFDPNSFVGTRVHAKLTQTIGKDIQGKPNGKVYVNVREWSSLD